MKIKSHYQRMKAVDILMGDTLSYARSVAGQIVNRIFNDAYPHNGAIIHIAIPQAQWIINVARWGELYEINHETHDKTGVDGGIGYMQTKEAGNGQAVCVERLARKLCMAMPAVTKKSDIKVSYVSIEQLPAFKPIAFLSAEEIFKAVESE